DLAVRTNPGDDDVQLLADLDHVLDRVDPIRLQLGDVEEAILARQDLDEAAGRDDRLHPAEEDVANLGHLRHALDRVDRLAGALLVDSADEDGAVVLDVDLGAGRLLDPADHLAARADDLTDLIRSDLDTVDPRRVRGHLRPRLRQHRVHLVEDVEPAAARLLERLAHDL